MAVKKQFLLRIPTDLWDDLNIWARDELRSVNSQIEYVLRQATRKRRTSESEGETDAAQEREE